MRGLSLFFVFLCALLCFSTSCTHINAQETGTTPYNHVIILAFDGWGSLSFESANMPFLKGILPLSAWTTQKRSILPTSSACNWATMFKGAGPEAHGYISWNSQVPAFDVSFKDDKGNFPSVFSLYREKYPDREMGYFYQWEGMKYIFDMEDFNCSKKFEVSSIGSDEMRDTAVLYIKEKKPGLALFVWDYPDAIGHSAGWYSPDYMAELIHIDEIIESVFISCIEAGIIDKTLFIITSDHGGHDNTHGEPVLSDLETPLVLYGKGINPGVISAPLMQYDISSIISDYLCIEQPIAWRGCTPDSLFNCL